VTSSGTNNPGSAPALLSEAFAAFDILCGDDGALGLAVSGGSDSTALLVLATEWGKARGKRIQAASVDHGLRAEARGEAEAAGELCRQLGIPHDILTWERQKTGAASQAEARDARHGLLATWAKAREIRTIALGHTRDDRVETFLMRVRAGSGWRGLSGPMPCGPSPAWPAGRGMRLVRPLLAFGREELRQMLRARNLGWAEDPSNEAVRFERVRMRQLTRQMEDVSLLRTLRVMDGLAAMRAATLVEARKGLTQVETSPDSATLPLEALTALGSEARARLLEALVMAAGGAATAPRSDALARAVSSLSGPMTSRSGFTLGGAWLRTEGQRLTISPAPPRNGEEAGSGPAWDRAAMLLCDPRTAVLGVRVDDGLPEEASNGEKDAGK
jgi:tRNA(Ile)-lysidine synthase